MRETGRKEECKGIAVVQASGLELGRRVAGGWKSGIDHRDIEEGE